MQRDWQLVAKGTRMTQEFAFFLKKLIDNINYQYDGGFFGVSKNCKDNIKNILVLLVLGSLESMHINGLFKKYRNSFSY
jgi:hypothetical protein